MSDSNSSFRRIAALAAVLSGILALAAVVIVFVAVEFDLELLADQTGLLALGPEATRLFRLGELVGLFGYYLLLAPVVVYLWHWLRPRRPLMVGLLTTFGLANIFVGAIGASLRAGVLPRLIEAYPSATEATRELSAMLFEVVIDVVFVGFGSVESLFAGVWLLGIGLVLRVEERALGVVAAVLGAGIFAAGIGDMLSIEALSALVLLYFVTPLWAIWLGVAIARHDDQGEQALTAAFAP